MHFFDQSSKEDDKRTKIGCCGNAWKIKKTHFSHIALPAVQNLAKIGDIGLVDVEIIIGLAEVASRSPGRPK